MSFNYVFNTNQDYAGLTTELPFIIKRKFREYSDCPRIAVHLLCVLIGKTQKINQRNESADIKYYESSTRDLAKMAGVQQTIMQRAVSWLVSNEWLTIRKGIDNPQKTCYVLNVDNINDLILQHQYD